MKKKGIIKCPVCQNETAQYLCPVCGYDLEHDYIIHNLLTSLDEEEIEAYQKKIDKLKEINETKQKLSVCKDDKTASFSPHSFNEVEKIADALKQHKTVLVSLESTSYDEGMKLLDFLKGCVYMGNGNINEISRFMLAITAKDSQFISFKLESFSDATKVADVLKKHNSILVDLNSIDIAQHRKIINFLAGCVYLNERYISRVSTGIYAISINDFLMEDTDIIFEEEYDND